MTNEAKNYAQKMVGNGAFSTVLANLHDKVRKDTATLSMFGHRHLAKKSSDKIEEYITKIIDNFEKIENNINSMNKKGAAQRNIDNAKSQIPDLVDEIKTATSDLLAEEEAMLIIDAGSLSSYLNEACNKVIDLWTAEYEFEDLKRDSNGQIISLDEFKTVKLPLKEGLKRSLEIQKYLEEIEKNPTKGTAYEKEPNKLKSLIKNIKKLSIFKLKRSDIEELYNSIKESIKKIEATAIAIKKYQKQDISNKNRLSHNTLANYKHMDPHTQIKDLNTTFKYTHREERADIKYAKEVKKATEFIKEHIGKTKEYNLNEIVSAINEVNNEADKLVKRFHTRVKFSWKMYKYLVKAYLQLKGLGKDYKKWGTKEFQALGKINEKLGKEMAKDFQDELIEMYKYVVVGERKALRTIKTEDYKKKFGKTVVKWGVPAAMVAGVATTTWLNYTSTGQNAWKQIKSLSREGYNIASNSIYDHLNAGDIDTFKSQINEYSKMGRPDFIVNMKVKINQSKITDHQKQELNQYADKQIKVAEKNSKKKDVRTVVEYLNKSTEKRAKGKVKEFMKKLKTIDAGLKLGTITPEFAGTFDETIDKLFDNADKHNNNWVNKDRRVLGIKYSAIWDWTSKDIDINDLINELQDNKMLSPKMKSKLLARLEVKMSTDKKVDIDDFNTAQTLADSMTSSEKKTLINKTWSKIFSSNKGLKTKAGSQLLNYMTKNIELVTKSGDKSLSGMVETLESQKTNKTGKEARKQFLEKLQAKLGKHNQVAKRIALIIPKL